MTELLFNAALAVDCVVFGYSEEGLGVLLVRRGADPFAGAWALPGGFVLAGESLHDAARRELVEETGVGDASLAQIGAFGDPDRDPRGRVVSVAWMALVRPGATQAGTDAADARWHPVTALPALAFDHAAIIQAARGELRRRAREAPVGFELLPDAFTFTDLQALYEALLGEELDKRNFRKKLLSTGLLVPLPERRAAAAGRPAGLWAFDTGRYAALAAAGFEFRL